MNVAILTTDTKHHRYFIQRIAAEHGIGGILYEERRLSKPYPTGPFFKDEEDLFEERFFDPDAGGVPRELDPVLRHRSISAASVNDPAALEWVTSVNPDIAVTFGVGRVAPHVIAIPRWGMINIHRGIVPQYRGLDSDLWAILEGQFEHIGVTVHYVDEALDTGSMLAQERLVIEPGDEIYHLRYRTTVLATDMVLRVLQHIAAAQRKLEGTRQPAEGRYFSAMPLDLKYQALDRFRAHQQQLARVGY